MTEIKLTKLRKTPIFYVDNADPRWNRIYGATFDKHSNRWLFPAVPPFIDKVLHDINKVYTQDQLSPDANNWVSSLKPLAQWREEVASLPLYLKSYDHQLDGLAECLRNYRWGLNWKMGTGKTKVMIDTITQLRCKALILCPLIAVGSWELELQKHAGGTLKVGVMQQQSPNTKRNLLKRIITQDYDVLVATYDATSTLGVPHISDPVYAHCKNNHVTMHEGIRKPLQKISTAAKQLELVKEWIKGRKPRDIREEIDTIVAKQPYQWMSDFNFSTIIGDESQRIKNKQSQRTKASLKLAVQASNRYILTGSLSEGNPWDLYPQLRFLAPFVMPEDTKKYSQTYFVYSPHNEKIVVGFKNMHVLNGRIRSISSHKELEDCVELPERKFIPIHFKLGSHQKSAYNQIVKEWALDLPDSTGIEIANGAVRVSKLLQVCSGFVYAPEDTGICDSCTNTVYCVRNRIIPGSSKCTLKDQFPKGRRSWRYGDNPKLTACKDLLLDILESGKVIIWAAMIQELDDIQELLNKLKIQHVRVDGTNTGKAKKLAASFEANPSFKVYLAQISTGIAITLNAARYTIYYSRSWSKEQQEQSEHRNYRIGQKKKTIVYNLCATNTVEVQQLNALEQKKRVSDMLTTRLNCSICTKYAKCLKEEIQPWDSECVLTSSVQREIVKARVLK